MRRLNKTVNDLTKLVTTENIVFSLPQSRVIISIEDRPVYKEDILRHRKDIRSTNGCYFIKYVPKGGPNHKAKTPFILGTDLLGFRTYLSGPKHLLAIRHHVKEIDWMFRNTTYNPHLFDVARQHPGVMIYFSLDFSRYVSELEKKIRDDGRVPMVDKPLVVFKVAHDYSGLVQLNENDTKPSPEEMSQQKVLIDRLAAKERFYEH